MDLDVFARYPDYEALVIYARDVTNGPSHDVGVSQLRAAERAACALFATGKPSEDPRIKAWRNAYAAFGSKPSHYPCSIESLLNRVSKGHDLPAISRVVDLYNEVSLRHLLPIGGEDWDQLASELVLKVASGDEPFVTLSDGEDVVTYPDRGEIVWADSTGVTCRRWNWRQCRRTQITETSRNQYFVLDRLPPLSRDALMTAGQDLMDGLKTMSPECTITYQVLDKRAADSRWRVGIRKGY